MLGVIFVRSSFQGSKNKKKGHQGDNQLELLAIFFLYVGDRRVVNPPKIEFISNKGGVLCTSNVIALRGYERKLL